MAPIAPGLLTTVGVEAVEDLTPGERYSVDLPRGVIALDGEREIEFGPGDSVSVSTKGTELDSSPTGLLESSKGTGWYSGQRAERSPNAWSR